MNSVSNDYSGDLAGMLFGVSEPLNFESRISDRERQVENTNLHCLSYTMYYAVAQDLRSHKHLHSSSCKNTDRIPVGLKVVDQYDRSHISRFPQGPVKVLYGRERPSLAGADLLSIVKKHRRSDDSWRL